MPTTKKTETRARASKVADKSSKAKAAFDEFKSRMDAPSIPKGMDATLNADQPFSRQHQFSPPPLHTPPPWPMMPPPMMHHGYPMPHGATPPTMANDSLFEKVGYMIRMGVDVINAGLSGSLQIIEGFTGMTSHGCNNYNWQGEYCADHSCCCYDDDCHSGVHNCY